MLAKSFRTCAELSTEQEAKGLVSWLQEPWSYLAMGNFPYASSYLVHGQGLLPAHPVRAACKPLDHLPVKASPGQLLRGAMVTFRLHTTSMIRGTRPRWLHSGSASVQA